MASDTTYRQAQDPGKRIRRAHTTKPEALVKPRRLSIHDVREQASQEDLLDDEGNVVNKDDEEMMSAFRAFDLDGSGEIDAEEILECLEKFFNIQITMKEAEEMMKVFDTSGDGELDFPEFKAMVSQIQGDRSAAVSLASYRPYCAPFKTTRMLRP